MRDLYISLIGVSPVKNERGVISRKTDSVVDYCWASKKSVTRSEFYAANAVGKNIDAVFEVSKIDFKPTVHTELECCGVRYVIERSYAVERQDAVYLSCRRRDI